MRVTKSDPAIKIKRRINPSQSLGYDIMATKRLDPCRYWFMSFAFVLINVGAGFVFFLKPPR